MNVAAIARPGGVRDIPWATWVLLVLGGLLFLYLLTQPGGVSLGIFAYVAPIFFAAAVIYAAPADRRFVWAAVLIALTPAVAVITAWLPDAWFAVAPGDWKNATPLLMDLGDPARLIASVLGFVGLGLLGLALGGVRTVSSAAILGVAVLLAVVNVMRFLGQPIEGMPTLDVARTIAFSTIHICGWAFVFAAALESRRVLTSIGFGLIVAIIALDYVQLYQPGPGDLLLVGIAALNLLGWALVILAALRGELNAAPARGRGAL